MKVVTTLVAIIAILAAAGLGYMYFKSNGELKDTKAKLTKAQQEASAAKAAKDEAEKATADIQAKLSTLETAKADVEKQLSEIKAKYEELTANIGSANEGEDALAGLQGTITDLKAQISAKEEEVKSVTEKVEALNGELETQKALVETLNKNVADAKAAQATAEKQANEYKLNLLEHGVPLEPDPVFSGEILAINPAGADYPASYIISIGKAAGLPVGQELKVVRGTDYIGTLNVVRIYDDAENLCGAETKDLVEGKSIQTGDKVSNQVGLKND